MKPYFAWATKSEEESGLVFIGEFSCCGEIKACVTRGVKPHQGKRRATALENAFAYVRFTMYDVRFINNVRVAQIFRIINVC